jgi:fumarate hydratase subunit alpha
MSRSITTDRITDAVADLCRRANVELEPDVRASLRNAVATETVPLARRTLLRILENADVAAQDRVPMCQDTGLVVAFVEVGQACQIVGGTLRSAIDAGVRRGYGEGFLRASVAPDPLLRGNSGDNTPAVIHTELVAGDQLRIVLLAKGGGCENMSRFTMLTPADGVEGVERFIVETAALAGPNACPPMVVGVGIGGSFELSAVLSKRALIRPVGSPHPLPHVADLERRATAAINATGIGPQGYGGDTTTLAVQVEVAACHIASLPVSVNIECHAHRHKEVVL